MELITWFPSADTENKRKKLATPQSFKNKAYINGAGLFLYWGIYYNHTTYNTCSWYIARGK